MIDFLIWPWIERFSLVAAVFPEVVLSKSNFPRLFAWKQNMMSLPAVKGIAFDAEFHQMFFQKWLEGSAEAYDVGLEE